MDNFGEHNFGNLKNKLQELINLTDSLEIYNNLDKLKDTLKSLKERLDYCGHCNGPTYENGNCTEHFTD